ncbi:GNAT family N-acetyltransferase [Sciscionella sediminilitoris]|uniref:GNAT family N-acetyltransferase n=1 Tax=Sciscionella sediminilitoris TaxID=1445613 RepID=UPI0004DEDF1A|nr:GNAT family N-acetyltransferase [Sciscionella sp. SE31]
MFAIEKTKVRSARSADLPAVARIYEHYVRTSLATFEENPPTLADWRAKFAELAAQGLPFLVAQSGTEILGYAYIAPWRPKPSYRYTGEDTIYLAPGQSGRGLGKALLGELLTRGAEAGIRQLIAVVVDTGDPSSAALHLAFGFTEAGRLTGVGEKHGRILDTVLYQRSL